LPCGYRCRWLRTVNIPVLKQWSRRMDARKVIRRWAAENQSDGVILTYSIPPFLVKDIIKYSKKFALKTAAIVADLPQNMYINHKGNRIIDAIKNQYLKSALRHQNEYDGYIYLTEYMRDVIAPQKPYVVMEGILNQEAEEKNDLVQKKPEPRAIMYAGRLHERYGVLNLMDAFEQLEVEHTELWLFGSGTAVEAIQDRTAKNPRIRYFGSVSRQEVLNYEKQATLLVNTRSTQEAFTEYSFPSKTIEYMVSGTPLLTTRLRGIPEEYFSYVFSIEDNEVEQLKIALEQILRMSDEDLEAKGNAARQFILEQKNAQKQSLRILEFLKGIIGE